MPYKKIMAGLLCLLLALFLMMQGREKQNTQGAKDNTQFNKHSIVLAARRHLAPGNKDGMYCSKILGVWEPLVTHDDNGLPKPCLAEAWEMKQGGKEWILHLRKNVLFHNGTPFTADSVIANLDRMKKGYKRSSFYGLNLAAYYPSLEKYEKLDRYTVRLLFREANVNQLYKMMDFGSPMYAPECFAEDGNFKEIAIGTGPYKITENVLNKYVRLSRFADYYGPKAHIEEFVIRNIPNEDVRYAALRAGEIQGVLDINAISPFLAEEISKNENFAISVNKSSMIRFLTMNGGRFPFNDVRMRRAVSLAIDREDFVKALYLGYAVPTTNILNYSSPYYKQFPVEYDLEQAKSLAREVLGDKRCAITYCINGSDPMQKGEAELIAYWLGKIGLDVTIQSLEYATMTAQMRKGEYDIARSQQGLPNGDPYSIFESFLMPGGARNIANSAKYRNEEVIELMQKVKHCADENERRRIFNRIQEISVEEQPVVPLFNDRSIVAYSKKLKNYHALIYGVDLAEVELSEP